MKYKHANLTEWLVENLFGVDCDIVFSAGGPGVSIPGVMACAPRLQQSSILKRTEHSISPISLNFTGLPYHNLLVHCSSGKSRSNAASE